MSIPINLGPVTVTRTTSLSRTPFFIEVEERHKDGY